ncbi:ATP-binding protein [Thermogemmatispora sp.]|uniref:sensor histidine kinase n=1 Tax=Thermogemmatispora sp. TaxID=1968838 RepID=UPI00260E7D3A|nr:ATP-binding protein [Thermogemmatispora sp.]
MALETLLAPVTLLHTLTLAVSIFNLVTFLWLASTVWLNGDHRARITLWGVVGLALSALFFFVHALLITLPLDQPALRPLLNILWQAAWFPALWVPYIWFAIGLHYASLINAGWRRRIPWLLALGAVLGTALLLLLLLNRRTFTFVETLQLLAYSTPPPSAGHAWISSLFLLPLLFLVYVAFCAIGPWFTSSRIQQVVVAGGRTLGMSLRARSRGGTRPALRRALLEAFWDDPTEVELLEEPQLSWHLARPALLLAALLMVALTIGLGLAGLWSMLRWLGRGAPLLALPPLRTIPSGLLLLDLIANLVVALIILVIGYSIVRHGILIERPLARRGFFEQWRGIVIVATAVALFIALLVSLTHSSLGGLLCITCLATLAYALFTWSSYRAHDRYIALLGRFLSSTSLRHWLNTSAEKSERELEDLFFSLCQSVLAVRCARLVILAGPMRRTFSYRWPADARFNGTELPRRGDGLVSAETDALVRLVPRRPPGGRGAGTPLAYRLRLRLASGEPLICWVMPLYDERGLVATLFLGPREDGGTFTKEDMNLAQACGQRILDTIGDHEAMQAVAALLRRRIVDVKLLGAQQRRILHDEILPQMHLALLHLETLRTVTHQKGQETARVALEEAVELVSAAHRQLAALMRATTPGAPYRLEREGLVQAIRTMLEQDFHDAFDEVCWQVDDETAAHIDEVTPPAIAELIFAAVQEVLRNAARHARGSDVHRRLRLTLQARCDPDLEVVVADDGVGIAAANAATSGTGGGLLTHSALLAIAGGSLTIKSAPDEGVTVRIYLPAEALL